MTERDAFEVRFHAAVRGYAGRVSSDLDPVELAHRIVATEPRRHGLAASLGWGRVAMPRLAWVLLLLAALLAAMVAGMLVVGSQPERKLPAVVPPVGPTTTPPTTYTAVSAGGGHTCAIRTDGTLECWGSNYYGQATPPDGTYVAVSAGGGHTCALKTDGTLTCWGWNLSGQATPPGGTYVAVSAGGHHTCAIRTDRTLECWGDDYGGSTAPSGTYSAVSADSADTCAIRTDGTLTCWGFDGEGRLSPPAGAYVSVDAFGQCAIGTDGTLACCGSGGREPTPPPGTYVSVSGAWSGPCAIGTDGTLTCWGPESGPPPPAGTFTVLSNSLLDWEACAIRTDGKLTCWGKGDWIAKTKPSSPYMGPPDTLIPDMRRIFPSSQVPEIGRGTVEFGSGGSGCGVTMPSTAFSVGDTIRFAATLEREVRAGEVVTLTLSVDGGRVTLEVWEYGTRTFDVPGDCIAGFLHWAYAAPPGIDLSAFPISWTTGHYRLEFSAGGKVLSRGEFDVGS